MMNREEALQWLVKNVKVWPDKWPDTKAIKHNGWEWALETTARDNKVFSFYNPENPNFIAIGKQDWLAAQPAPVSNKPSWDDAPEGTKILVQSENGLWNFGSYAGVDDIKNYWTGIGKGFWFPSIKDAPNPNWRDTLEYRPVVKESLTTEGKQDDFLQYVPKNLARIKQLNDEIELAKLSIETMGIELAERMEEVRDVLNYCKFNA